MEKDYTVKVNFSISYEYGVRAKSEEEATQRATERAYEDLDVDLHGYLDTDSFGVEAEVVDE